MEIQERPHSGDHLRYLDAARGIAALMVLGYHFIGWRYHGETEVKWANFLFNGSDAVSFFFVLSGFVLSYKPVVHFQPVSVPRFYLSRLFRLVPAFVAIICAGVIYRHRYELTVGSLADEFIFNKEQLWEELFLLRDRTRLYVPGWTLQIELAISFFIPFVILMAARNRKVLPWLLLCVLLEGHTLINHFHLDFILGVVLSCYYRDLRAASFKQHWLYRRRYLLLLAAVLLFSIRHIEQLSAFGPTYNYLAAYLQIDLFIYTGFASFIIIGWLITSDRMQRLLSNRVLLFAGKVSYGIYLAHWMVVDFVNGKIEAWVPAFPGFRSGFLVLGLLALVLTLVLATLLHYLVELPFIRLGKRFAARIRPGLVVQYKGDEDTTRQMKC
jgi:peptidoglycan/LPS O-acetylase OafA/YrhL